MNSLRRSAQQGFTLIEVIVVVAIIGLLAAIVVPVVAGKIQEAKVTSQQADLKEISNAFNRFFVDTQLWPDPGGANTWDPSTGTAFAPAQLTAATGNKAIWLAPAAGTGAAATLATTWKGPYLNSNDQVFASGTAAVTTGMRDRWNMPLYFAYNTALTGSIVIASSGPDATIAAATKTAMAAGGCPAAGATDDVCQVVTLRTK